ncbi:hypothetical protein FA10DRAFT_263651 [Acaromyces ingoldii]|uniref:DASH complex subunit DAD4 n=1 Tax=Acaromyces ingoldii TaxID=215250 RepID=A0A316YU10_9BASI|nr:hypothetical protein FA10DRAFT_263651 [Acaromyces ingoldii]PWN92917.1 hypothetical protein FA10DRAFT_263651 [Acaromyces ingoldii]
MENPHEERQSMLLERIIKNVDLLNDAMVELTRSMAEINEFNQRVTIVSELWEGVSRGSDDSHSSNDAQGH